MWNMRKQAAVLVGVVLLDAAVFGTALGVMHAAAGRSDMVQYVHDHVQAVYLAAAEPDLDLEQDFAGCVALTFDDGPSAACTPKLLDGLKKRGIHATFFLMGQSIPGNEELVRRMKDEGHLIGNHSYRHIQLTKEGEDAVCDAVEKTEELIVSITGERPQYMRPPYGDWNESLECRMNLTTVFWSVDSLDWKLQNTVRIVRRLEECVGAGDIILMHDIFPTSVEAAFQIIDRLQAKGYRFVTVDELLID